MTRLALALAALLAFAAPAAAQLPSGNFTSDNVEFVKNIVTHSDAPGARLKDGYFYVTTERDLTIYDVKDPENPAEVGSLLFGADTGQYYFPEEDVDTNGRILLTWNGESLQVIDVSDKANPVIVGRAAGPDQHTVSCVLDCTYAYGSEGQIVDIRDPSNPKVVGDWVKQFAPDSTHDVTEVAPGLLVTSSQPMLYLDARADPAHPKLLASTEMPGFTHANLWPHEGTDDFLLVGGEATGAPADCSQNESATFQTWDTRNWREGSRFKLIDQFRETTGTLTDSHSPYTTFCVHWFTPHPTYRNGGLLAIGWYEHGTRFLKIDTAGKISEVGYYLPYLSQSSAAYWITDRIVYVADYQRGLDIIKFTGEIPQGRPDPAAPAATPSASPGPAAKPPRPGPGVGAYVGLPAARGCVRSLKVKLHRYRADPAVKVTTYLSGRRAKVVRGRALKRPVRLKRLPRKRFELQVVVQAKSGYQTAGQRSYRGC